MGSIPIAGIGIVRFRAVRSPVGIGERRSLVGVAMLLPPVKIDSDGESQTGATGG